MSKRIQRCLTAVALVGAFLLTAPAPTLAAGFWRPAAEAPGLVARAWAWMAKIGVVPRMAVVWEKEGSAIDPDGAPRTSTTPTPPANALSPQPAGGLDGLQ
jgi:hypothetical protein